MDARPVRHKDTCAPDEGMGVCIVGQVLLVALSVGLTPEFADPGVVGNLDKVLIVIRTDDAPKVRTEVLRDEIMGHGVCRVGRLPKPGGVRKYDHPIGGDGQKPQWGVGGSCGLAVWGRDGAHYRGFAVAAERC